MAMNIRISTGTTVQAISIGVLWLNRAGSGLARLLKRRMTMASKIRTKAATEMMIGEKDPVVEEQLVGPDLGDARLQVNSLGHGLARNIGGHGARRRDKPGKSRPGSRRQPRNTRYAESHVPRGLV